MQKKNKKVIYTCITNNYDQIINHDFVNPDYDYICFTDNITENKNNYIWEFRSLRFNKLDNIRNARWHKLHPHLILSEYKESLYVDGNVNIKDQKFFEKLQYFENETEFMRIQPHFIRKNIYEEFAECIKIVKDDINLMKLQMKAIKKSDFDGNYYNQHFFETNVVLRRHNDQTCTKIMEDWWWWLENYSRRDQLSLTYVLWKNKVNIEYLFPSNIRELNFIEFQNNLSHHSNEYILKKNFEKEFNLSKKLKKDIEKIEKSKTFRFLTRMKICKYFIYKKHTKEFNKIEYSEENLIKISQENQIKNNLLNSYLNSWWYKLWQNYKKLLKTIKNKKNS